MLAYCIASGVQHGLLIYPLDFEAPEDVVEIRNSEIVIEQIAINLGLPFSRFQKEGEHFTTTILARASLAQSGSFKNIAEPAFVQN